MTTILVEGIPCSGKTSLARALLVGDWKTRFDACIHLGEAYTVLPVADPACTTVARLRRLTSIVRTIERMHRDHHTSRLSDVLPPLAILERLHLTFAVSHDPRKVDLEPYRRINERLHALDALVVLTTVPARALRRRLRLATAERGEWFGRIFGPRATGARHLDRLMRKQENYRALLEGSGLRWIEVDTSASSTECLSRLIAAC
ncbi:MAG: hypothetical protein U0166_20710 [Acidobacteriota bacterium]